MNLNYLLYSIVCVLSVLFSVNNSILQTYTEIVNCDFSIQEFSESRSLDASNIPPELLIDAHAVVRFEDKTCNILSKNRLQIVVEKAVTILSEKGIPFGDVSIRYNSKADKIKDLKIEILDSKGERITKINKKEINDVSEYDGFSIANDSRRKAYRYVSNSYPYTILYSYKKETSNTLIIPSWYPVAYNNVSLEESLYKINSNVSELTIRHKAYNIKSHSIIIDTIENIFRAKNIRAIKSEKKMPTEYKYWPFVRVSPSSFNYFEFEGEYSDWRSYGKWMYDNMLTGRGELPPTLISEIEQKLGPDLTNIEKAKIIYDYVVNSTRYVSVQLGIGGWMPFKCSDVYDLKYGDCKALSFYTQNLMQHFGIEAIYTEIKSDRKFNYDYDTDLPGFDQGNHIVLCLPNDGDTIWLECTTQNYPFGYIHSGINSRKALLIKPSGGELVTTSTYSAAENLSVRNLELQLGTNDGLSIEFVNKHKNLKHENMLPLVDIKKSKRDKYLKEYYYDQLASLQIESYELDMDDEYATMSERGRFYTTNHVEKAGNYKMIPLYVFEFSIPKKLDKDRSFPIYIKDYKSDSIHIKMVIPKGMTYVFEEDKNRYFENEYGNLSSKMVYNENENSIGVEMYFQYNAGTFTAESVKEYNDFVKEIKEIVDQKIILKPTE